MSFQVPFAHISSRLYFWTFYLFPWPSFRYCVYSQFLVAYTRLYKTLCWLVGLSVGPTVLVRLLVVPSVGYIYFQSRILLFWGLQKLITAPAQPHATEIAVYTALFFLRFKGPVQRIWGPVYGQPDSQTKVSRVQLQGQPKSNIQNHHQGFSYLAECSDKPAKRVSKSGKGVWWLIGIAWCSVWGRMNKQTDKGWINRQIKDE